MDIVFLDTETTGLNRDGKDRIVEISIIDGRGDILLDTLVNPQRSIPAEASKIHGITTLMCYSKPTLQDLEITICNILRGKLLVIYNSAYDCSFLSPMMISEPIQIDCCMTRFARFWGDWIDHHRDYKRKTLEFAAKQAGHKWRGKSHRALSDAQACRTVWRYLDAVDKMMEDEIKFEILF